MNKELEEMSEEFFNNLSDEEQIELVGRENWLISQPWIFKKVNEKTEEVKYYVLCPVLADYVRNNQNYIYVSTRIGGQPERYIYRHEKGVYEPVYDDEVKGYIKSLIPQFIQRPRDIEDTFKLLKYDNTIDIISRAALDSDEQLINFKNGLLNIDTFEFQNHSADKLMTIQLPMLYEKSNYECPVFDDYIFSLASGSKKAVKVLLQFIGLAVSNVDVSRTKTSLLLVGKGNTGKSQYSALISKLVGENNYTPTTLAMLESNRFESARLFGKRLAVDDDMQQTRLKEISIFKKLTGGDLLPAEYKGGAQFDFKYKGLLLFCANQFPKFGGDKGEHVYKRFVIMECNNVIPEDKQDKHLIDKMYNERAAIVNKSLICLHELIDNGYKFDLPEECMKAVDMYKVVNNSVLMFLEECCIFRPGTPSKNDGCTTGRMFEAYKIWCDKYNNGRRVTKNEFKITLTDYYDDDDIEIRTKHGRYYKCTLTSDAKKDLNIYDTWSNTYIV